MTDRSAELRARLATVGITLDDAPAKPAARAPAPSPLPDRAAIRAILGPLGAPEWAIESCPSVALAMTWRPPIASDLNGRR